MNISRNTEKAEKGGGKRSDDNEGNTEREEWELNECDEDGEEESTSLV